VKEFPSKNYKNFSISDKKIFSERMEEFLSKIGSGKVLILLENIHPCIFLFKIYPLIPSSQRLSFFYTHPLLTSVKIKKKQKKNFICWHPL